MYIKLKTITYVLLIQLIMINNTLIEEILFSFVVYIMCVVVPKRNQNKMESVLLSPNISVYYMPYRNTPSHIH